MAPADLIDVDNSVGVVIEVGEVGKAIGIVVLDAIDLVEPAVTVAVEIDGIVGLPSVSELNGSVSMSRSPASSLSGIGVLVAVQVLKVGDAICICVALRGALIEVGDRIAVGVVARIDILIVVVVSAACGGPHANMTVTTTAPKALWHKQPHGRVRYPNRSVLRRQSACEAHSVHEDGPPALVVAGKRPRLQPGRLMMVSFHYVGSQLRAHPRQAGPLPDEGSDESASSSPGTLTLPMSELSADELLDDINTDAMTPAWVCFDYDPARHREERLRRPRRSAGSG